MQRQLLITKDGSHTLSIPETGVTYRSIHGAIAEAKHVFIQSGFNTIKTLNKKAPIKILEVGLGSGLNALMTIIEAIDQDRPTHYTALEPFPVPYDEIRQLNYPDYISGINTSDLLKLIHVCESDHDIELHQNFTFRKKLTTLEQFLSSTSKEKFHLIYFDPFAPKASPELWGLPVFQELFYILENGGILVTYCSKGSVQRNMKAAGFKVEKLAGPPGKREIIRAVKP